MARDGYQTITVSDETMSELESAKPDDASWNAFLSDLVSEEPEDASTEAPDSDVEERLDRIESYLDTLERRTNSLPSDVADQLR